MPNPYFRQQTTPKTTATIMVYLAQVSADGGSDSPLWLVLDTTHDRDLCTAPSDGETAAPDSATGRGPPYPSYLKFSAYGLSDCVYTGTSSTIGSVQCQGLSSSVSCTHVDNASLIDCSSYGGLSTYLPVLQCSW